MPQIKEQGGAATAAREHGDGPDAQEEALRQHHRARLSLHLQGGEADLRRFPRKVGEMTLTRALRGKTEAACMRSDLPDKRHALMRDWAAFCFSVPGTP